MGFRVLLALSLLSASPAPAQLRFALVNRDIVEQRLKSVVPENKKREIMLKADFEAAGCHEVTEQPVKHVDQPNVICVLRGDSPSTIVVGAHLDKVPMGVGAVDDWSGAALLPSLFQGLVGRPHTHTFVFIGFSGEEQGLLGSKFYVKNLANDDWSKIVAMVNLECLGLGPTKVWVTHSDPNLVSLLGATATSMKIPVGPMNVDRVGTDDSESFRQKKVPNITIHSITQDTWPILHTGRDQLGNINLDSYYESYRLAAAYLAVLDSNLPSIPPHPATVEQEPTLRTPQ